MEVVVENRRNLSQVIERKLRPESVLALRFAQLQPCLQDFPPDGLELRRIRLAGEPAFGLGDRDVGAAAVEDRKLERCPQFPGRCPWRGGGTGSGLSESAFVSASTAKRVSRRGRYSAKALIVELANAPTPLAMSK